MDNFIQITVFCPPEPRLDAFVYRNAGKVYWGVGSLRSKRFRASSSRKLGREQKRGMGGEGEGREGNAKQARVYVIWVFVISRFHCFIITLRLSLGPSSHYFEPPCKSYRGIGLLFTQVRLWRSDF